MHCIVAHRWFSVLGRPVAVDRSNDCNRQMDMITSKASISVIDL